MMLVVRVGVQDLAVPIAHVVETMRPLPIVAPGDGDGDADADAEGEGALVGEAIVRGAAIPIVDAARLVLPRAVRTTPTRLVILRAGDARVGLLVDAVLGVRAVATAAAGLSSDVPGLAAPLAAVVASARVVEPAA